MQSKPFTTSAGFRPAAGNRAAGHGVGGAIAAVPEQQPLGRQGIWRITLEGEGCGRLVRCKGQEHGSAVWRLLQLDDVTDEQLDAYEAATLDPPRGSGGPPVMTLCAPALHCAT